MLLYAYSDSRSFASIRGSKDAELLLYLCSPCFLLSNLLPWLSWH